MTRLQAALNWRPKTPFFYGWLVLGVSALGAFVATSLAGVVLGGIQGLIFEETGWNRSTIGLAAAAGVWGSGLLAPFIGGLADRYNPRWLMSLGTLVLGICLFSLGGSHSIWSFFLAAVLARAISQPLLIGVIPQTLAVNFFQRKRNTALALTGMFRPLSGAVLIQLISAMAVVYGWRFAFRGLGILSVLLTLPMLLMIRRHPEDIGLLPDGDTAAAQAPTESPTRQHNPGSRQAGGGETLERVWIARAVLRTRAFWLVAVTTFLGVTSSSAIGFNMVPYLYEQAHLSTTQAAGVLSLSTFLALANLVWGHVADTFTPRRCIIGTMIASAAMMLYLFSVSSLFSAYVFGILWGITSSSFDVLKHMLLAHYFGRASYGTIAGALRPFEAGGLGLGQSLGAVMYDVTGSYTGLIVAALGAYLLAACLIFSVRPPALPPAPAAPDVH
ncbi:hypothetical protein NKDENANG_01436 [Candidatus Entotheonellaceae bacterium PAL068K]